jgi:CYTH domain-containing protein
MAEIHLNEAEYAALEHLSGREIRKNRYFHEFDRVSFAFDVYLGKLWGLNTAMVEFQTREEMLAFIAPPFAVFEVTDDAFFAGASLVEKTFADIQAEVSRLGHTVAVASDMPDE